MKVTKCTLAQFKKDFGSEEQCMEYLQHQKWQSGYQCRKCGGTASKKGDRVFDKRCKKCGYNESPLAHTIFHGLKFSLATAFEMVYRISVNKKGVSSIALCREFGVNLKTAYNFKRKVQYAMKSSGNHPLGGMVHVDEFVIGGPEEGKKGRSIDTEKKKICIAVEIIENQHSSEKTIGNAYAISIENYSANELTKLFEKHIDEQATIQTDEWKGYNPLKKHYNITQVKSEQGRNFPQLHLLIMNIKSWIRGIHHSVSKNHIQRYLDEFFFRFNRRKWIDRIPILLLNKMIKTDKIIVKSTIGGFYG